jgi:hypothetical protein
VETSRACISAWIVPGLDRDVAGQLHVRPEVTHKLDL